MPNLNKGYLFPFACFECRRSFKRQPDLETRPCPYCGAPAVRLSRKFKAPKKDDLKQWEKVRFLVDHGFYFDSLQAAAYPETIAEAREFVKRHAIHANPRRRNFST